MSDKDANNTQIDMQLKNKHMVGDAESSLQTTSRWLVSLANSWLMSLVWRLVGG